MPLLKFSCKECGETFEIFLSWSEARKPVTCPACQGKLVGRVSGATGSTAGTAGAGCSLSKKS
jgi:putative FmdB family regulatory protein